MKKNVWVITCPMLIGQKVMTIYLLLVSLEILGIIIFFCHFMQNSSQPNYVCRAFSENGNYYLKQTIKKHDFLYVMDLHYEN